MASFSEHKSVASDESRHELPPVLRTAGVVPTVFATDGDSVRHNPADQEQYAPVSGMPPRPRFIRFPAVFSTLCVHQMLILIIAFISFHTLFSTRNLLAIHHPDFANGRDFELSVLAKNDDIFMQYLTMLMIPAMVVFAYWNWLSKEYVRYG